MLFKISKGLKANLPETKTAGYCWYTIDDSLFYIDYEDENGEVQRKALNGKDAETLLGMSLEEIQKSISWNNLLDKPFGEVETEGAVLVPETTFSGTTTTTIFLDSIIRFGDYYNDTIIVEFDGTKYTTQMWTEYTGGADIYGVGDVDLDTTYGDYFSNDTDLPFCVIQESTGLDMCSLSAFNDAEHTIKIYVPTVETKTIDEIYIPDTVIKTTAQTLTDEQKTQARENIDAASVEYVDSKTVYVPLNSTNSTSSLGDGWTYETIKAELDQNHDVILIDDRTTTDSDTGETIAYTYFYRPFYTQEGTNEYISFYHFIDGVQRKIIILADNTITYQIMKDTMWVQVVSATSNYGLGDGYTYDKIVELIQQRRPVYLYMLLSTGARQVYSPVGLVKYSNYDYVVPEFTMHYNNTSVAKLVVHPESAYPDGNVLRTTNTLVTTTRTINGHALSANVTLTAEDVGAATPDYVTENSSKVEIVRW